MKVRKKKGSALYQYVIIIALVALALIPVLMALSNITNQTFENYLSYYTTMSKNVEKNAAMPIKGPLGGTPANPVSNCNAGTCEVDFGDYLLTGIPEDFQSLVQTSGTSGGADQLADIFAQLAEQMKTENPDGYSDYMRLANLVHLQADIVRHVENKAKTGATQPEFNDFYVKQSLAQTGYTPPAELASVLPNGLSMSYNLAFTQNWMNELGLARSKQVNDAGFFNAVKGSYPAFAIVDQYDQIMANSKYSDNLKSLTQELYLNIADLSINSANLMSVASSCSDPAGCNSGMATYDPITGAPVSSLQTSVNPSTSMEAVVHPQYSLKQDFDGALVCTAGKNVDTGRSCH